MKKQSESSPGQFLSSNDACPIISAINRFIYSNWYFVFAGTLILISNVFAAELVVYPIIVLLGIYITVFCRDMLPTMPLFILSYISPSLGNNPGSNPDSIFYPNNGGIFMLIMVGIFVIAQIIRFAMDKPLRSRLLHNKRGLMIGILILDGAYLLSGIGRQDYTDIMGQNLRFAFVQVLSVTALYWYFCGAVDWEKAPKNFFGGMGITIAFVLLLELAHIYITQDVILDGQIQRDRIMTGWGIYNNIGGLLAMMLPFPYYFASQSQKNAWIYHIIGWIMLGGLLLSNSRSSILCGAAIYLVCLVAVLWKARNRLQNGICYAVTALACLGILCVFKEELTNAFIILVEAGLNPSGRDSIYATGMDLFRQHLIFGDSFFSDVEELNRFHLEAYVSFFPFRWHNTVVQLAASCGIVGLAAYGIHRIQTAVLFFKRENRFTHKAFIGLSVVVLLTTSLLDCHLFNIGPAMYYSMALAFAEHSVARIE